MTTISPSTCRVFDRVAAGSDPSVAKRTVISGTRIREPLSATVNCHVLSSRPPMYRASVTSPQDENRKFKCGFQENDATVASEKTANGVNPGLQGPISLKERARNCILPKRGEVASSSTKEMRFPIHSGSGRSVRYSYAVVRAEFDPPVSCCHSTSSNCLEGIRDHESRASARCRKPG